VLLRSLPIGKELHRAVGALGELPISYAERTQWSEEALLIAREIGFPWGIAASLSVLSEIAHKQGHYAEARKGCEEALLIFRELDNQYGVSSELRQLSYLAFREGQFSEARHFAQKALSAATAINFPRGSLRAHRLLGRAYHAEGNYIQAKHHYAESIAIARAIGFGSHLPVTLALYGLSTSALGEFQEAWQHFQQGLKLATQTRGFSDWPVILVITAEFLAKMGNLELAAEVSTLGVSYPASSAETREQAEKLLAELKPKLPPEVFMSEGGKEITVEQTVEKLLAITLWPETPILHTIHSLPHDLSERELEILRLIADGLSNREIADQLVVALSTVKWHINQIYGKLGVDSRTRATARARELNILS
jgi:ATP/maltotriose-dependent transcriptional regulator MalT